MKVKRRKKSTRFRGSRMNRRGYKNRTKGSGNRGGKGMSGTGKRGDQRKTLVLNQFGNKYFRKDKTTSKNGKVKSISLRSLEEQLETFVKTGKATHTTGTYEVKLPKHKIVGNKATIKMIIHAQEASAGAIEAVKAVGGSVHLKPASE